jgi:hypothetical protein
VNLPELLSLPILTVLAILLIRGSANSLRMSAWGRELLRGTGVKDASLGKRNEAAAMRLAAVGTVVALIVGRIGNAIGDAHCCESFTYRVSKLYGWSLTALAFVFAVITLNHAVAALRDRSRGAT